MQNFTVLEKKNFGHSSDLLNVLLSKKYYNIIKNDFKRNNSETHHLEYNLSLFKNTFFLYYTRFIFEANTKLINRCLLS